MGVAIAALDDPTPYSGQKANSKKDAEQAAAKAALKALGAPLKPQTKKQMKTQVKQAKQPKEPKEPKLIPKGTVQNDPVSKLFTSIAVLASRTLTKADLTFTSETIGTPPDAKIKCTLVINCLDSNKKYIGDPKDSKSEAKKSVAAKALGQLKSKIDVAMKKHKVAKEAKEAEWQAKLAEKKALEESGGTPEPPKKKAKAKAR